MILSSDQWCFLVLAAIILIRYLALPKNGDIEWSDASRHALNGVFILDFAKGMPFRHPTEFAYDYYRQWPALTILFYPPLFYVVLALTYAVFGVSEASALLVELGFLLLLAWGAYRLSRNWLDPLPSLATTLLLIGAPDLAYWGQQIMLDIPAYAILIWAAEFLVRYMKNESRAGLFAAVVCTVAAVYTKYNAIFFGAVIAIAVLHVRGWRALRDATVLQAAALGGVLLLPAVAIFFVFGHYNLEQAAAVPGSAARWSASGLTYYARTLPSVLSWPTVVLACLYVLALPFFPALRLPWGDGVLLSGWVVSGFIFYSVISLKEPRDILFITYPFALSAVLVVERTVAQLTLRRIILVVVAVGVGASTLVTRPPPFVTGMRKAAQVVAQLAPPETNVGFWGTLDGTFIFAMRAYSGRRDLGVVRLDKLLFSNLTVAFERGFTENVMTPEQITDLLFKLHVQYLVIQTGYHDDLASVKMLEAALASNKFTEVERVPMTSNYHFPFVTQLVIYRLRAQVPRGLVAPQMQIKLLGRSL
jgi:hypothetical protein